MNSHWWVTITLSFVLAALPKDVFAAPSKGEAGGAPDDEVASAARYLDGAILRDFETHWERYAWLNRHSNPSKPAIPGRTDDASFLRRACVDLAGRLPRADEVRAFLADRSADKRAKLTDGLLKEPGAAEVRFRIYAEAFRVTDTVGDASQAPFIAWLRKAAAEDMPFDDMIRAMLVAKPGTAPAGLLARDAGEPMRTACSLADAVLGKNLYCAMCHDHPFNENTQMQCYQFAACFKNLKLPDIYLYADAKPASDVQPIPFGLRYPISNLRDGDEMVQRRDAVADALAGVDAKRTRQIAALRVWRSLFGEPGFGSHGDYTRYGVETPPAWKEVMPAHFENKRTSCFAVPYSQIWSEDDFNGDRHWGAVQAIQEVAEHCHMRLGELQRILARTEAYGRESLVGGDLAAVSYLTVAPQFRRLPSEVIWDSLVDRLPMGQENWRTSANSPQVPNADHPLRLLGRGRREWPDESQTPLSFDLARFMIAGPVVTQAVSLHPKLEIDDLFMSILSRPPTPEERAKANEHVGNSSATAVQDLTWALLNTSEFLFQH